MARKVEPVKWTSSEWCEHIQAIIDNTSEHLTGLRTTCTTEHSSVQNEIRVLETRIVRLFAQQLVLRQDAQKTNEVSAEISNLPNLKQWLEIIGVSDHNIENIQRLTNDNFEQMLDQIDDNFDDAFREGTAEEKRRFWAAFRNLQKLVKRLQLGLEPMYQFTPGTEDLSWECIKTSEPAQPIPPGTPKTGSNQIKGAHKKKSAHQRKIATPTQAISETKVSKSRSNYEHQLREDISDNHCDKHRIPRRRLQTEPTTSGGHLSPSRSPSFATSPDASADNAFVDAPDGCPTSSQQNYLSHITHASSGQSAHPHPNTISVPRSPRLPGMGHAIHHRFATTVKVTTCQQCEKPMFFGYKCRECKFRCHRDCVDKVPPSCGLPSELLDVFAVRYQQGAGESLSSPIRSQSPSSARFPRHPGTGNSHFVGAHPQEAGDSSSNTSSCNSSAPNSPLVVGNSTSKGAKFFRFPPTDDLVLYRSKGQQSQLQQQENYNQGDLDDHSNHHHYLKPQPQSPQQQQPKLLQQHQQHIVQQKLQRQQQQAQMKPQQQLPPITKSQQVVIIRSHPPLQQPDAYAKDSLRSTDSDKTVISGSNSGSLSLSLREWDIPIDEVQLEEKLGEGHFGVVYKGSWHGAVAVKMLNVEKASHQRKNEIMEAFKQEVATFRKTRHENLVLFMGACMKPPQLAIITSLCKGMTLYRHLHLRKDRFNNGRIGSIALQICLGMGYLHARGILHKDLKTKNIFYENGKVVITDFGLFSVVKLCQTTRRGNWLTIPQGWLCYLAPELIRDLRSGADHPDLSFSTRSDVYSFGTVFFELMTGDWPFRAQPPETIIWQVAKGVKPALANLQSTVEFKDILMSCWAYHAHDRPDFVRLQMYLLRLPKRKLSRCPSQPINLSRSAESVF